MSLAGFDDAPVYVRLPQFDDGTYVGEVIRLERFKTDEGDRFKIEARIVWAAPGSKLNVGDEVAEVLPLFGKYKLTFFGKVKNMLGALAGEDPRTIKTSDIDEAVAEDQPYKGIKFKAYVQTTKKKDKDETYPRVTYTTFVPTSTSTAAAPA